MCSTMTIYFIFFLFREARFQHGAAVVDDNIYVVGGKQDPMVANYSHITGEILKSNMCIVYIWSWNHNWQGYFSGVNNFTLNNTGENTCATNYQGALVMIGGCCPGHGKVDRWKIPKNILIHFFPSYNSEGKYVNSSVPDLNEPRYGHACTTYISSKGEEVCLPICVFSILSSGLAGCWRDQPCWTKSQQHRGVLAVQQGLDKTRGTSQALVFNCK